MNQILINTRFTDAFLCDKRYLGLYGGAGSGKSFAAAQKIISRIQVERNHRFLLVRKTNTSIRESVFKLIGQVLSNRGIANKSNKTFNSFDIPDYNSEIISFGLDDPDKLKSISGITGVWIEEADQLEEYDFDQLNLRLRGETPSYKQIILTWNPVDENHWLKRKFFDEANEDVFTLHSTYLDNEFIDEEYKNVLERQFMHDDNLYRIYVKGEWGKPRTGQEYYHKFNRTLHASSRVEMIEGEPLHITFDFNRLPYMTLSVWQLLSTNEGYQFNCIRTYSNEPPNNTIEDTCEIFLLDYASQLKYGLYVYGDTSGKNQQPVRKMRSFYDVLIEAMDGYVNHDNLRLLKANPRHKQRVHVINKALKLDEHFKIRIDEDNCKDLINDFERVKMDANGKKHKETKKINGVTVEIVGHHTDAFDYLFMYILDKEPKDDSDWSAYNTIR